MVEVVVRDAQRIAEVIHGDRVADVVVESLEIPDADAPLAVERTVSVRGPTRPPVVLVHGLAQNRFTWRVTGRSLSAYLADEGFEVLNLELRGHGNARRYGSGNATSFDAYVTDLVRVIGRCERRPFLVGHSLGAAVCLGAASRSDVAGVVHLAGVYTFATGNRTLRAIARLSLAAEPVLRLAPVRMSTGWAGDLIGRLYAITDIVGFGAPISGWVPDSMERDLLEERLRLGFDWTSVEVWLQMSRWACGERLAFADAFCARDVPLLIMVGDHDPLVRPEDGMALYRESCSSDRTFLLMEAFEHQVHWGHVDLILGRKAPEETWPRILDWLQSRSSSSASPAPARAG